MNDKTKEAVQCQLLFKVGAIIESVKIKCLLEFIIWPSRAFT